MIKKTILTLSLTMSLGAQAAGCFDSIDCQSKADRLTAKAATEARCRSEALAVLSIDNINRGSKEFANLEACLKNKSDAKLAKRKRVLEALKALK